jgi:hypothetical protein
LSMNDRWLPANSTGPWRGTVDSPLTRIRHHTRKKAMAPHLATMYLQPTAETYRPASHGDHPPHPTRPPAGHAGKSPPLPDRDMALTCGDAPPARNDRVDIASPGTRFIRGEVATNQFRGTTTPGRGPRLSRKRLSSCVRLSERPKSRGPARRIVQG